MHVTIEIEVLLHMVLKQFLKMLTFRKDGIVPPKNLTQVKNFVMECDFASKGKEIKEDKGEFLAILDIALVSFEETRLKENSSNPKMDSKFFTNTNEKSKKKSKKITKDKPKRHKEENNWKTNVK